MKVSPEQLENRQVSLTIEVEGNEVDPYLDKAYNHLVGKVKVKGFRKGKTPRAVLERFVGRDTLLQEAMDYLIPDVYQKALNEQNIEPIARPEFHLLQIEPVILKAIVPLSPIIKLGDYKSVRVESKPVEVTEKETEVALQQLRLQHSTLIPAERPAKAGDMVTMDLEGESEGKPFPIRKDLVYELVKESPLPLPGFVEQIEGMSKGDEKNFTLSYPADHKIAEIAGKEYSFKVKITEIKEQKLPELNDEFAVSIGAENIESLEEQITTRLKSRTEESARLELEQKIMDKAVELSSIEYPPILVENEIDHLIEEEARGFPEGIHGLENYLKSVSKTMDDHRGALKEVATRRILRSLVLEKIAEEEKIAVIDSEIDNEIEKMVKDAGDQSEQVRQLFSVPQARKSIEQFLISKKTLDLMKQIAGESA